ncbi:hypothetical protein LEMLEM_LOCUS21694 [Lemmus lemmus]
MVLYNHPAENYFWRILGNLRPAEDSLPPTRKSAYDEQGFFFKIFYQRSKDTWTK